MLLSLCFVTNATGTTANELELATAEKIEQMVSVFYSGIPGDYEIGNAMTIYNADVESVYYVIPIFRDEECVGTAEVDSMGNVSLCDDTTLYANVSELSLSEYLLYTTGGSVYAENEDNVVELRDNNFNVSTNYNFTSSTYVEKDILADTCFGISALSFDILEVINEVELLDIVVSGASSRAENPSITIRRCSITNFVTQGNYDLCWAATVATIANYKKGLNLTAIGVSNAMGKYDYNATASSSEVISAFSLYGLSYSSVSGKLAWSSIKNNINNNRPFAAGFTSSQGWHLMTGYGYECYNQDTTQNSGMRLVYIWDSNGYQRVFAHNSSTYTMEGYSWTWVETFVD